MQQNKKKLHKIESEFMQMQKRSKIINVDPIFNDPAYLGLGNKPLPPERYLIEIAYPKVLVAYKDQMLSQYLNEKDVEQLIRCDF